MLYAFGRDVFLPALRRKYIKRKGAGSTAAPIIYSLILNRMFIISIENIEGTCASLYIVNIESGIYKYEIHTINIISLFKGDIFFMSENSLYTHVIKKDKIRTAQHISGYITHSPR
ncbi:MAG: hypothetical protein IJN29_01445 [Akkermansia sp.]|nr:hypothetical protein [Akkermansia sp.]